MSATNRKRMRPGDKLRAKSASSFKMREKFCVKNSVQKDEEEDENVGEQALQFGEEIVDVSSSKAQKKYYSKKLQRQKLKDEKGGVEKTEGSHVQSKKKHKERVQKDNLKAKDTVIDGAKNIGTKIVKCVKGFGQGMYVAVTKNPTMLLVFAIIGVLLLLIVCMLGSCALILPSGGNALLGASFTAEDEEILNVNTDYTTLEAELLITIDSIETDNPGYDEYNYSLDVIEHNPYALASYLTVVYEDYERNEVQTRLQELFDAQYELSIQEVIETRTRLETRTRWESRTRIEERTGTRLVWDSELRRFVTETYTYEVEVQYWVEVEYQVEVEYDYYILNIALSNAGLDSVVTSGLDEEQLARYYLLMNVSGNKAYLFENG